MASSAYTSSPPTRRATAAGDDDPVPRWYCPPDLTPAQSWRIKVVLTVHGALRGEVFDNLRAVSVKTSASTVRLHFYTLAEPSEDDVESASVVETGVMAGLDPQATVEHKISLLPFPQPLPDDGGEYVFSKRWPIVESRE